MPDQSSLLEVDSGWGVILRAPDEPFEPGYLAGASCGGLELAKVLYWYSGPLLFLARDRYVNAYLVVEVHSSSDARTHTHMALALTPEQHAAMAAAPDIETINDIARRALHAGGSARIVISGWDGSLLRERQMSMEDALECIGVGHETSAPAPAPAPAPGSLK